jgi:hypothetical protein
MKPLLLSLAILAFTITASSQVNPNDANPVKRDLEKTVTDFTQQFYTSLEGIINAKDGNMEPVVKMLDKDYTMTRHILDVNNRLTKSTSNFNEFKMQTAAQMSISGLSVSFKMDRVNFVMAYEHFALINYSVWLNANLNGEPMLRFRSHITNYMRKDEQGNWKIYESNGANVYKEQEIGWCPCGISKTSKDDSQYAVKILSPSGNSFSSDNLVFDFKSADQKTLIVSGENAYTLDKGELVCVKDNGSVVNTKLGKAVTPVECINLILAKHLYASRCMGFKPLSK